MNVKVVITTALKCALTQMAHSSAPAMMDTCSALMEVNAMVMLLHVVNLVLYSGNISCSCVFIV